MSKKGYIISIILFVFGATVMVVVRSARQPVRIATGCFHQVAHKGTGCAAISQRVGGRMVLELTGLSTAAGSANEVILTSAGDAFENETVKSADKLILGGLESGKEYQEFTIPVGTDIFAFHSVTIWNSKYQVNFTTAPLR